MIEIPPSASMAVTAKANELRNNGEDVVALSMGDTHFAIPKAIDAAIDKAIKEQRTHYLGAGGIPELKKAINEVEFNNRLDEDNILITPGAKQGFFYLLSALDVQKVAMIEPAWLGYQSTCLLTGKQYLPINAKQTDWLEQLEATDFDLVVACMPNNPDGQMMSKDEFARLLEICQAKQSWLLLDTIYKHYAYDRPMPDLSQAMAYPKVLILDGFSKSHAMTGLRIGYLAGNKQAISDCGIYHQHIATCTNSLAQFGALGFVEALEQVKEYRDYYRQNRDLVAQIIPQFAEFKPDGGFYYFVDLSHWGITDAVAFCQDLLESQKVALVPGGAYGQGFDCWVRLSFSIDRATLIKGLERIKTYLNEQL